ncbi:nitric oxide dioxygenase [Labrenzia sp. EL_208]|nr:nitric oxide dioxygenase [Labrenzia sp. EL_132]MBG6230833.1 nitric oxide dioxygenase [Labrenzia sp. EL_208]
MKINAEEIDLVRTSYLQLSADIQRAGDIFYEKLFEIAPETKELFINDLDTQSAKLMSTLGLVVSQLQNSSELKPVVEDLALRHLAYGVKPQHYELVRTALIEMLKVMLDRSVPADVFNAWEKTYDGLADVMMKAAYQLK